MRRGFTLVETVVTIVVLSIVSFSIMHIMVEGLRIWWENRNYIELRSDGRFALTRLQAEFRTAYSASQNAATDITFNSDVDNDGDLEEITYALSGTELTRDEGGAVTICQDVSSLAFSWSPPMLTVNISLSKQNDTVDLMSRITSRCIPLD